MKDDYGKRLLNHYKIQDDVLWDLMLIAQRLCPGGEWVFQMFAHQEYDPESKRLKKKFMATCTNGDDNVTAVCDTPGAAVALLVHYLLSGSVFPLQLARAAENFSRLIKDGLGLANSRTK